MAKRSRRASPKDAGGEQADQGKEAKASVPPETVLHPRPKTKVKPQFDLTAIREQITKKYGAEALSNFTGGRREVPVFPTGIKVLDEALMVGGIARGRMIELFGPQHVGKTSLAMHIAAHVQSYGLPVIWHDYEHAFDMNYAQIFSLSFDPQFMVFAQPNSMEEGFGEIEIALEGGFPGLIVVDSIPAARPLAILEAKIEDDKRPGYEALRLTRSIERLLKPLAESQAAFLGLNQRRDIIGGNVGKYTPKEEKYGTPGGHGWKHYTSIRISLNLAHGEGWEARNKRSEIRARIIKNKVGMPYQEAILNLIPGVGFVG